MKIYTRTGDAGTTSLVGGKRIPKDSPRIEAYGTIDELNSHVGNILAIASHDTEALDDTDREVLTGILSRLFDLGAYLADDSADATPSGITDTTVTAIEDAIDSMDAGLPRLTSFILPTGTPAAAAAHIARTVARRAERRMLTLAATAPIAPVTLRYINRLSDYLFTLARHLNHRAGQPETPWIHA